MPLVPLETFSEVSTKYPLQNVVPNMLGLVYFLGLVTGFRIPHKALWASLPKIQVDREQWTEHWDKDTKRNTSP